MHPDPGTGCADIAIPTDHGAGLDRYARLDAGRQHTIAIGLILLFEQFPRGHADHTRRNTFLLERLIDFNAERNLTAGTDEDHQRVAAFGIGHDIGAAREPCGRSIALAVKGWQRLAAKNQAGGLMLQPYVDAPLLGGLSVVAS